MNTRMMASAGRGRMLQCENVAKSDTNCQLETRLETGNIGIGNTCTMATLNKMFARDVAGRFFDRINKIDRIMGNERKS